MGTPLEIGFTSARKSSFVALSVDETDVRTEEPTPFNPKFYSHKFKSAALRYEFGIFVTSGHIVWVHGPYPAGEFSDQSIFNRRLQRMLVKGEKC